MKTFFYIILIGGIISGYLFLENKQEVTVIRPTKTIHLISEEMDYFNPYITVIDTITVKVGDTLYYEDGKLYRDRIIGYQSIVQSIN